MIDIKYNESVEKIDNKIACLILIPKEIFLFEKSIFQKIAENWKIDFIYSKKVLKYRKWFFIY